MTRDELIEALLVERHLPIPPHLPPAKRAALDTPGNIARRRLEAARELDPRFAGTATDLDPEEPR
jgi:hypothetical protein